MEDPTKLIDYKETHKIERFLKLTEFQEGITFSEIKEEVEKIELENCDLNVDIKNHGIKNSVHMIIQLELSVESLMKALNYQAIEYGYMEYIDKLDEILNNYMK